MSSKTATGSTNSSLIPPGYTYFTLDTLITIKGRDMAVDLLEKAANRNPDDFDMYIYNDYYAYAVMDLIDDTMTVLHTKITKKAWDDAYAALEALSILNEVESVWTTCDDGSRTKITIKAYGACIVALLHGLDSAGRLNSEHYPSLESLLRNLVRWGKAFEWIGASTFHVVCQAVGKRLFKDKTQANRDRERARLDEWLETIDPEDKEEARKQLEKRDEERARDLAKGKVEPAWYEGGLEGEALAGRNLQWTRIWKEYRKFVKNDPNVPMKGPPIWDLTQWTEEEQRPFKFDALGEDN